MASIARNCGWLCSITCCSTRLMRLLPPVYPHGPGDDRILDPANRLLFTAPEQMYYSQTDVSSGEKVGRYSEMTREVVVLVNDFYTPDVLRDVLGEIETLR